MNAQGFKSNIIIDYLIHRDWQLLRKTDKFVRLKPSASLELPASYSLVIPIRENTLDYGRSILRVIKVISEIYDISELKLTNLFLQDGTILSFRFVDEETARGSLSLRHFEGFLEKFKKALLDIASATALKTPFVEEYALEAETYLNHCKYLQTEHGSFVTNIQLPSELILRQPSLFDQSPMLAEEINQKLFEYLQFTVESVLENDERIYSDDFVEQRQNFLSVQIFEDIDGIIRKANSRNIYFSFIGKTYSKEVKAENLTEEKYAYLSEFIRFLKQEVEENIALDVIGKIVELRSRNPNSDRNYILVSTQFEEQAIFLAMHLDNVDYQRAIQAHRNNREINVRGRAKRMKTQYKITSLEYLREV